MKITVCIGSSCHLKGSRFIVDELLRLAGEYNMTDSVEMMGAFCMGNCMEGVCVKMEDQLFSVRPENTEKFFYKEILGRL
ncbi:MAG: NADH dehydrogenase [Clostridiales bacterium 43-6]|nr:MAG: NADH dehydrogenase [Clostridiales bacterium 43-6]